MILLRLALLTSSLLALLSCPTWAQTTFEAKLKAAETPSPVAPAAPRAPVIFSAPDQLPVFPGGSEALGKFLASKLQYPGRALDQGISGKVHVTFTVDSAGHLRDPRVVKGVGYGLDEEALRLVRIMPWWEPGQHQGRPVWVQVTMPIVFRTQ